MIKNDFEKLNSDDWLAKEIQRESRISAWDMDGRYFVQSEHEENCDLKQVSDFHVKAHEKRKALPSLAKQNNASLSMWIIIDILAIVEMMIFNAYINLSLFPPILLFLLINPGIFVWLLLLKKTPGPKYFAAILVAALILELLILMNTVMLRF